MGLKSNDILSPKDWEFVKKLNKVGYVHVLSHQVSLRFEQNQDIGTDKATKLIFPPNWSLQYVSVIPGKYEDRHSVSMTWEILPDTFLNPKL